MKDFASSSYRLTSASTNLRRVLGFFLICMLLGLITNIVMTYQQTEFTPAGISTYYRGSDGPLEDTLVFPKSARELLMNSHFHLFMMPLVLLVLCHIFYMTTAPEGAKTGLTVVSFVSLLVEIGGPWLIRYVSSGFAIVMLIANLLLVLSVLALILAPLYEIWFRPREAPDPQAVRGRDA
jgi:hypothetical protein